jgi:toxin ParE1/3/4
LTYRLLGGAEDDIDHILLASARDWGLPAAERYHWLMLTVFAALGATPDPAASRVIARVPGVRAYPLRLGRRLIEPGQRVGHPRHIVVYRVAEDGVVEIMGLAHDRMLLTRAARQMRRAAGS